MSERALLDVDIELKSPLVVGDRRAGQGLIESLKYVPGRVLRGALAGALLADTAHPPGNCKEECDFCSLFVHEDGAIFRNAYPASGDKSSRLLPSTAVGCKQHGDEHGRFDTLIPRLAATLKGGVYRPVCPNQKCREAGRVERAGGYCAVDDAEMKKVSPPSTVELIKVGIDRARRAASDEILYSLVALRERQGDAPTRFRAQVDVPQQFSDSVRSLLAERVRSLGGATSRGLGSAALHVTPGKFARTSVGARLDEFARRLNEAVKSVKAGCVPVPDTWAGIEGGCFFSIDLLSDAILTDPTTGLSDFVLQADMLQRAADCDAEVRLLWASATPSTRSGWNEAWGLPRPVDAVSQAGGVFVYWTPARKAWSEALDRLERRGVGARINEGFGQIEVCATVHR